MNDVKTAAPDPAALSGLEPDDALWYKDAVIYQLNVKSFFDSNDDGIGDFAGLTSKLDYIRDLGVNTIWLMPFYPSPMLDDGYDVADYRNVHPPYGTRADVKRFVREAHERGLRIITDTESSNWAWDPVAQQHYWHRFFSHQPDLNFDNPHVLRAVLRTMHFWLEMGVDGFRLDAIPYLVEREGTSNENNP